MDLDQQQPHAAAADRCRVHPHQHLLARLGPALHQRQVRFLRDAVAVDVQPERSLHGLDIALRDPLQARQTGRVGLASMQERATEMGWTLRVEAVPGRGTRVLVAKGPGGTRHT